MFDNGPVSSITNYDVIGVKGGNKEVPYLDFLSHTGKFNFEEPSLTENYKKLSSVSL